ncbi:MAG: AraC family transcriptional regulator [Clostridia bacterium]|nr:AraC family transcriptional regulator [Clostridia bacterium]
MEITANYHVNNYYLKSPLEFKDLLLYQIGRKYCREGDVTPRHVHDKLFELTIVKGGSATLITNGERFRITAGYIYLSFPYEIHEIHADQGEKFDYDFFAFYPTSPQLVADFESILANHNSPSLRTFADDKVSSLIDFALSEFPLQDSESELLNGLFYSALTYIVRDFNGISRPKLSVSGAEIICMQVMNYIDTHLLTISTLTEVAEKFNYNYSYLSSLFKSTTGKNLADYFRSKKLQTAKVLLTTGKKSVTETAVILNYSSPFAFTKAFKTAFNVSPKEYAKSKKARK